jgi:hypothetical protein
MKKVIFTLISLIFAISLFGQTNSSFKAFDKIYQDILSDYISVDSLETKKQLDIKGNLITEYRINPTDKLIATIHYFIGYDAEKVNRIVQISDFAGLKLYEYILMESNAISTTYTFDKKEEFLDTEEKLFPGLGYCKEYVYEYGQLTDTINRHLIFDKSKDISIDDIYGPWWSDLSENAVLSFYRDSVFYVDNLEYYKYDLRNDSLIIYFEGFIDNGVILRVTNDSIFWKNSYDVVNELIRDEK